MLHMFAAGVSRWVGLKPFRVYYLAADSADTVWPALDFVQSAFKVLIAGFQSIHDSHVLFVTFDIVRDGVFVRLRSVLIGGSGFPVREIVGISPADCFQLFFQERFFCLQFLFEVSVIYGHIPILSEGGLTGKF